MGHSLPCCTDEVGDYLNSEGSDEDMPEIRSSAQIEVIAQKDETEDVGTLETSEAPMENIPLPVASMETPTSEVSPATKATVTEQVITAEHVSLETSQGKVTESEVNITSSASAGNNYSVLNLAHVFYIRC